MDGVQNEEKVEVGEWFYTSGDDRVFPKGMPAGQVKVARQGSSFQEVLVDPSGMQNGLEEVLIVLEGVHQQIPTLPNASASRCICRHLRRRTMRLPEAPTSTQAAPGTDADRLRDRYKALGEAQGFKFGEGGPGAKAPDFNAPLPAATPAPKPLGSAANRRQNPVDSRLRFQFRIQLRGQR